MKLLKDEIITKESDGVKITLNPVMTSMQAALIDISITVGGAKGKIEASCYALKYIINELEIKGVNYKPYDVAERADLGDSDTIKTMLLIGRLIDEACFASSEQKKSSETSDLPSSKENIAQDAHDQAAG